MRAAFIVAAAAGLLAGAARAGPPPPPPQAGSDVEMTRIFEADQKARTPPIDWVKVEPEDSQRREATRKLLAVGRLHTGEDYLHAAYVFQHGPATNDYLLAHTLAMVAAGKGVQGGLWIAAATLDRYLMRSGQPQIYGTQYVGSQKTELMRQEPYDRSLISDAMRRDLGVPIQSEQAETLAKMNTKAPAKP